MYHLCPVEWILIINIDTSLNDLNNEYRLIAQMLLAMRIYFIFWISLPPPSASAPRNLEYASLLSGCFHAGILHLYICCPGVTRMETLRPENLLFSTWIIQPTSFCIDLASLPIIDELRLSICYGSYKSNSFRRNILVFQHLKSLIWVFVKSCYWAGAKNWVRTQSTARRVKTVLVSLIGTYFIKKV